MKAVDAHVVRFDENTGSPTLICLDKATESYTPPCWLYRDEGEESSEGQCLLVLATESDNGWLTGYVPPEENDVHPSSIIFDDDGNLLVDIDAHHK